MAPTAMKTVPSGIFDSCIYGAFSVGGTATTGPEVEVEEEEDVEPVVVETEDVDVLSVDVEEEEDVVVDESMVD